MTAETAHPHAALINQWASDPDRWRVEWQTHDDLWVECQKEHLLTYKHRNFRLVDRYAEPDSPGYAAFKAAAQAASLPQTWEQAHQPMWEAAAAAAIAYYKRVSNAG